jgi:tetratricopeptide (TPR) repeat protein
MLLRRAPRTGVLAGMALVALAPVANLVPLTIGDNIVHDRYLLLPLVFLSLALVTLPVVRIRRTAVLGAALWAALSLTAIILTVPRWESNLSLWGWAYALEPKSNIARGNYVAALVNSGHYQAAMDISQETLRNSPDNPIALYNMGLSLMRLGRNEEARKYCEMSLQRLDKADTKGNMDITEAWNLLGYLSMLSADWDGAEKSLNEAIRLTPYLTRPHFNLAMVNYERGRSEAGDKELAFALSYDSPEMAATHRDQAAKKKAGLLARSQTAR